jgi:hypothetical protein
MGWKRSVFVLSVLAILPAQAFGVAGQVFGDGGYSGCGNPKGILGQGESSIARMNSLTKTADSWENLRA